MTPLAVHWAMNRHQIAAWAGALVLGLAAQQAGAQDDRTNTIDGLTGPAAPKNMTIDDRDMINLAAEFPEAGLDSRFMRGRFVVVGPEGIVPIHSHHGRPAIIYA